MVLAHRSLLFFLTTTETGKEVSSAVSRCAGPSQRLKKASSCPSVGQWRGCGPPPQSEAPGGLLDAIWSVRSSVTMTNKKTPTPWHIMASVRRKKNMHTYWDHPCLRDPQTSGGRSHHRIPVIPRGRDVSTAPDAVLRPFIVKEPCRLEKKSASKHQQKKTKNAY